MNKDLLKPNFNFEEFLDKKLLDISDLEHRKELKGVTKEIMLPLYDYIESSYQQQIERMEEKSINRDYSIVIGVAEKNRIDLSDERLLPIEIEDMEEHLIDDQLIRQELKEKKACIMYSVFMQLEYKQIMDIIYSNRIFNGTVTTDEGVYRATFQIRKCTKYIDKVQALYPIFVKNMINWKTVNMAYLFKFVDIIMVGADLPDDENIIRIKVEFEEYSDAIKYNMVPLWNVKKLVVRDSGYPELCLDHIHYKHVIFQHKLKEDSAYLVDNPLVSIWNIYYDNDDMVILCNKESDISWNLLEIHNIEETDKLHTYLSNRDLINSSYVIHTKSEIYKFVKSLNCEKYLILKEVNVTNNIGIHRDNYNMNVDLQDEVRLNTSSKCLELKFVPQSMDEYLNEDILSYILSRLQWEVPEYECCGYLLKGDYYA